MGKPPDAGLMAAAPFCCTKFPFAGLPEAALEEAHKRFMHIRQLAPR